MSLLNLNWIVLTLLCFYIVTVSSSFSTGFWYSKNASVPPDLNYNSVAYANITVKVNRSNDDGPGRNLVTDPFRPGNGLYTGNTIFRETFDTQFVLDMSSAIGINVDRIFVTHVIPGYVHFSWESSSVIVYFVILERNSTSDPSLLEALSEVTNQVQNYSSSIFRGNVTQNIDPYWGVQVVTWDISLRLNYAIEVVGGAEVIDGDYLNQGGLGICNLDGAQNYPTYCEFERFFEDDLSNCLSISSYRIHVMFVKKAALDQVLVFFRIMPSKRDSTETDVSRAIANLISQVGDRSSELYKGNVTLRVDPVWGVSQTLPTQRIEAPLFTQNYYQYSEKRLADKQRMLLMTAYDRCKANRRCNWGIAALEQSTNDVKYYQQLFDRGKLYNAGLFLDFEDWRLGARSFNMEGVHAPSNDSRRWIRGSHFEIFELDSITGADVPSYLGGSNQGLVLDRMNLRQELDYQEALVADLKGEINWMQENIETATMSAHLRSRKDVRASMEHTIISTTSWWKSEEDELRQLNSSQCVQTSCYLLFNTSSLTLTGAISGKGEVKRTANGTEVAVFTFNSIYLGPEVQVTLVGQRALALVSKTSAVINTTFRIDAGTLGGFRGGGIVGRLRSQSLSDDPMPVFLCELYNYCPASNTTFTAAQRNDTATLNANGPGSGSVRLYAFDIATIATDRREIQVISTTSVWGQTIRGGFTLQYQGYSTPVIPHNCTADELQAILEENLNLQVPADLPIEELRTNGRPAGIGIVSVDRSTPDQQGGYNWTVTFSSAIGNVDQMTATAYLYGVNSTVAVRTLQQGNQVGGTFTLQFQGYETVPISAYETEAGLTAKLLELSPIASAYVSRYDTVGNCNDGQCQDGPLPWGGLVWSIYITTNTSGGDSPSSPAAIASTVDPEVYMLTADSTGLTGANASVVISWGNVKSRDYLLSLLKVRGPYSLAFGGAGASYGGYGGAGYNGNPTGKPYNDKQITDLLGGSGGCVRSPLPYELNALYNVVPTGLGGNGGGAIEIVAANDIVIGNFGRIFARGNDGESQSGGGSGGGSGGAVVLAAGAAIYHQGEIDVGGGAGGYSGGSRSGGGGSGGRLAMFAESIVQTGTVKASGGHCGGYKIPTSQAILVVNITVEMVTSIWLGHSYVSHLGELFVNQTVAPIRTVTTNITSNIYVNGSDRTIFYFQNVEMSFFFNGTHNNSVEFASALQNKFDMGYGYSISQITMLNVTVNGYSDGLYNTITMLLGFGDPCSTNGEDGSIFTEAQMNSSILSLVTDGAESTTRALLLSNLGDSVQFTTANGPITSFNASQPGRVTYYIRMSPLAANALKMNFGALFTLISRKEDNLNVSQVIGVFMGERIMYGTNFGSSFDPNVFDKILHTIDDYCQFNSWYKVDIHLNWPKRQYNIFLNDYLVVGNQSFVAKSVDGIRLSVSRLTQAWFDEIYVGFDNMMDFTCPTTNRRGTNTAAPKQQSWDFSEVHGPNTDGYTEYYQMTRNYNDLDASKTVHFDGDGQVKNFQDIPLILGQGDYPIDQGILHAGTLVYLQNSLRTGRSPTAAEATSVSPAGLWNVDPLAFSNAAGDGRQYWYTEYTFQSTIDPTLSGGIAACSSQDLNIWRFEGIIMHYVNMTDTVYGLSGPFVVQRPKILFNNATKSYVMWAVMEDKNQSLAMNVVATSPYEDGPFLFRRSFYPDGNLTKDQVIFVNDEKRPVLTRTYYQTVEYLLPGAIMQPVWESVKFRNGSVNYRNNYHRAFYHIGYDYYHDIFNQRWRKEDKPWSVKCVNRITGAVREVPYGSEQAGVPVCIDPEEYKVVDGQGAPVISTHFVSPNDSANSWWMQTSVPAVKAQPWANSYRDGYCGIRKLDNGYDTFDPILADFVPPNLGTCSNIADNPVQETLQDKLIGVQKVVYTRRAKFVAISELTYDYLDTTGKLVSLEGELEAGRLVTLIPQNGQFGFGPGDVIQSTFTPPMRSEFNTSSDWEYRFRQYLVNYNDRATYALACVLDGVCPVNYKDEIAYGQS